jgi:hypothetical protein
MRSVRDLAEQAKQLSAQERRQLIEELKDSLEEPASEPAARGATYALTVALAGTGRSDFTDVSTDKYKHLAEIYADDHEPLK